MLIYWWRPCCSYLCYPIMCIYVTISEKLATKTNTNKNTTQYVLDTTIRTQAQITKIRHEHFYKQLAQTFCTNSVAANRTNVFILSKLCRTDDFSHFYFVDIFPTEHVPGALYVSYRHKLRHKHLLKSIHIIVFYIIPDDIFVSQELRSALLNFTLGIARRI
jgi:hypothetical protein